MTKDTQGSDYNTSYQQRNNPVLFLPRHTKYNVQRPLMCSVHRKDSRHTTGTTQWKYNMLPERLVNMSITITPITNKILTQVGSTPHVPIQ